MWCRYRWCAHCGQQELPALQWYGTPDRHHVPPAGVVLPSVSVPVVELVVLVVPLVVLVELVVELALEQHMPQAVAP